jgi:PAS domain S-box-containing protein
MEVSRTNAERESHNSTEQGESLFSAALESAKDLLAVIVDTDGRIVQFNRTCQQLTDYTVNEVIGRRVWDFLLLPEEVDAVKSVFNGLVTGAAPHRFENHWVGKNGQRRLIAWSNSAVTRSNGSVEYVIGTGIDITETQIARERAQASQVTVSALLETAAQAILAVDRGGRVLLCNAAAQAMFGYKREEMLTLKLEDLIPERHRSQHVADRATYFAAPRTRAMGLGLDLTGLRKDGSEFPVEISLSHAETQNLTIAVAFVSDISQRKLWEEAIRESESNARESAERLRDLTLNLVTAQEGERRRVSRELHDDLIQRMALLTSDIRGLEDEVPEGASIVRQKLQSLASRLSAVTDDIRRTAYQLHPSVLEHLGLIPALESYCSHFASHHPIKIIFRHRKVPESIPEDVSLGLYRIAQECLQNVAKHSCASRASVGLAGAQNGLLLTVADLGVGFDPAAAKMSRLGLGLVSMEERARAINGSFSIRSRPNAGTRVKVRVPLNPGSYSENG